MEEVVQINLPVPLGIDVGGQVHAGEFAGEALFVLVPFGHHFLVVVVGGFAVVAQVF